MWILKSQNSTVKSQVCLLKHFFLKNFSDIHSKYFPCCILLKSYKLLFTLIIYEGQVSIFNRFIVSFNINFRTLNVNFIISTFWAYRASMSSTTQNCSFHEVSIISKWKFSQNMQLFLGGILNDKILHMLIMSCMYVILDHSHCYYYGCPH